MGRFLGSWVCFRTGAVWGRLAFTDNPISRRWGWPYDIYSFFMVLSENIQGEGCGPWKEPEESRHEL